MKRTFLKAAIITILAMNWIGTVPAQAQPNLAGSAKVAATTLNVRSQPDAGSKVVGTLSNNTVVAISDEAYGWIKVKSGNMSGWVAGQYLIKQTGSTAANPSGKSGSVTTASGSSGNANVLVDSLYMRKGPGTEHTALGVLSQGDKLQVMERNQDWVKVKAANGLNGWVFGKYIGSQPAKTAAQQLGSSSKGLQGKVIVIDPGHGGNDNGVIGKKYASSEKTLNLKTSLYLADKLRSAGAQAILTRTSDKEKPELSKRVVISESKHADAFISIHYNSSPKPVSGTLTFYYSKTKDMPLARKIESRLDQSLELKSNGISFGDYHVLRENARPSALVELGFLSNAKDEGVVRTSAYQQKAAEAIVSGLKDYFNSM
ncbi:N-acetylmuramoyl-L-alanine amidase [Paenibacillus doosanensis]|uniref:N-acetylmuramoyl-L-alanine amidase n=1 Tax=Paenibacillus doosanensis TaxID=1229154 RepID=UPI00217FAD50|nr:N-acetylmuramoyl-L-alanine amidase [Paenibacillus doosanensis]MCS7462280.1 N-acetylmuramoyl-L-alanine amidase [Paenibacillus doosanensis]